MTQRAMVMPESKLFHLVPRFLTGGHSQNVPADDGGEFGIFFPLTIFKKKISYFTHAKSKVNKKHQQKVAKFWLKMCTHKG